MSPAHDAPPDDQAPPDVQAMLRRFSLPAAALTCYRELGTTPLALQLGLRDDQLGGHWCRRCVGIWYGCALEVQCPACGYRGG